MHTKNDTKTEKSWFEQHQRPISMVEVWCRENVVMTINR